MNPIDLLVLVLLVAGGFLGWVNGVIKWLFTLIGLIGGIYLASRVYRSLDWTVPLVEDDGLRQLVAFAVILIVVCAAGWAVGRMIRKMLSMFMLGWVDRVGGLVAGMSVGLLGAAAVALAAANVPSDEVQQAVDDSLLAGALLDATSFLQDLMPEEFDIPEDPFRR